MEVKKIKEFIDLAKSEGVSELKYKSGDVEMAVSFQTTSTAPVYSPVSTTAQPQAANQSQPKAPMSGKVIKSPLVGTFYGSSSPGDPAFVKIGDKVSKGQILCIVEAMKIMNEIEADQNGTIAEILVDNEDLVEFGQALFRIE